MVSEVGSLSRSVMVATKAHESEYHTLPSVHILDLRILYGDRVTMRWVEPFFFFLIKDLSISLSKYHEHKVLI
jgi:hypothetical protein